MRDFLQQKNIGGSQPRGSVDVAPHLVEIRLVIQVQGSDGDRTGYRGGFQAGKIRKVSRSGPAGQDQHAGKRQNTGGQPILHYFTLPDPAEAIESPAPPARIRPRPRARSGTRPPHPPAYPRLNRPSGTSA